MITIYEFIGIGIAIGAVLAFILTYMYFRRGISKKCKELEQLAAESKQYSEDLIEEAVKSAENKKREFLLQAQEEVHRTKVELEKDVKERRQEILRERSKLEQKESALDKRSDKLSGKESELGELQSNLEAKAAELQDLECKHREELLRIANLSQGEAKQIVLDAAEKEYRHDMAVLYHKLEDEAKQNADAMAKELVVSSIQRYASDYVSDATVSVVNLPNEEMKGRIIGREGRNIRTIEQLTGIDLIIDDTPEAVIISCFDPIRREVARLALEKLVQDGRIHPARIEDAVEKAKTQVDASIKQAGQDAVYETVVLGLPNELVNILGRLKYRTSYGQNVLQHSIEVSHLAGMMAAELGLDVDTAKRAGLLHDIGKAVDFEKEGTHIELGSEIAKRFKLDAETVNSIESHHGDVEPATMIASLVAAADAISAARPGARRENVETYIKRIEKLEEIANSFEGVENSYAVQAGREIRVIVQPDKLSDGDMELRAHEICKKIEEEVNFPGQIKVNLIRESRYVAIAK